MIGKRLSQQSTRSKHPKLVLAATNLLLVAVMLISCTPSAPVNRELSLVEAEEVGMSTERLQHLAGLVDGWVKSGDMTGASYVIMRRGKLVAHEVFGLASDSPQPVPVAKETIFGILSLSKIVMGTAVMVALDRGQLSLSDTVGEVLPEFSTGDKGKITVEQLLTLSSGLGLLPDLQVIGILTAKEASEAEWRDAVKQATLDFEPGTEVVYSPSFGSNLLKWMMEKKTGQDIEEYCRENIFEPLGMTSTSYRPPREDWPRIARMYSQSPAQEALSNSEYARTRLTAVWGSLFTTPADLARLLQTYLDGGQFEGYRLLSPEMVSRGTTIRTEAMTLRPGAPGDMGFHFRVKGTRVFMDNFGDRTSPATFGFSGANATWAWADPERELVVVFFCNRVNTSPERIEHVRTFNDEVVASILAE